MRNHTFKFAVITDSKIYSEMLSQFRQGQIRPINRSPNAFKVEFLKYVRSCLFVTRTTPIFWTCIVTEMGIPSIRRDSTFKLKTIHI